MSGSVKIETEKTLKNLKSDVKIKNNSRSCGTFENESEKTSDCCVVRGRATLNFVTFFYSYKFSGLNVST